MTDLFALDKTYIANTYARFPVELVSGHGSILTDANGKDYIDMGSGIAVNGFGIGDPIWKQAVIAQLDKVQHTSNLYYTEPCVLLAKLLCERTGMKKVFFGNSGAEANECAVKVARKWAAEHKGPAYSTVLTLWNSFHGRTLTTLAATGQEHYHELYQPLTPGFAHVQPNDLADVKAKLTEHKCAAILMECIQGEGGVKVMEPDFVRGVAALCAEYDVLLMIDEVQTGNGRSGQLYSYMNYGVTPDVVTTAKGLGGGLPLGAALLGEKVADVFTPGDHGSTFGGNPVCCAGAVSVLSRIDDELLSQVREKSAYVFEQLSGAPGVEAVSGMGLMIGIKPKEKAAADVVKACMEQGVLCLTAKDRVRLLPALNIPTELLEKAVAVIKAALAE
jgi:acetylornithine/N-succinyldiaminopimelate aminotransferase